MRVSAHDLAVALGIETDLVAPVPAATFESWREALARYLQERLVVSAEDQTRADERIPDLLATPAVVRGVSAEPLLGPIDLDNLGRSLDRLARDVPGEDDRDRKSVV